MNSKALFLLVLTTTIALLLDSCSELQAVSTPGPSTSTSTASPSSTSTPIITPTVTQTPDPNAPQGTPGQDSIGRYIEANGMKNRQIKLVDPVTGATTKIWVRSLNAGEKPIPIFDVVKAANDVGNNDQLFFQLLVDPSVPGAEIVPIFNHPPK